jgi:hypothetical protein
MARRCRMQAQRTTQTARLRKPDDHDAAMQWHNDQQQRVSPNCAVRLTRERFELQLYRGRLSIPETSVKLGASARMRELRNADKIGKPYLQESIVEGVVGGDRDNNSSKSRSRDWFFRKVPDKAR